MKLQPWCLIDHPVLCCIAACLELTPPAGCVTSRRDGHQQLQLPPPLTKNQNLHLHLEPEHFLCRDRILPNVRTCLPHTHCVTPWMWRRACRWSSSISFGCQLQSVSLPLTGDELLTGTHLLLSAAEGKHWFSSYGRTSLWGWQGWENTEAATHPPIFIPAGSTCGFF